MSFCTRFESQLQVVFIYSFFPQDTFIELTSTEYSFGWNSRSKLPEITKYYRNRLIYNHTRIRKISHNKSSLIISFFLLTNIFTIVVHTMMIYFLVQNMWFFRWKHHKYSKNRIFCNSKSVLPDWGDLYKYSKKNFSSAQATVVGAQNCS